MTPQGNSSDLDFPLLGPRRVLADFDGGDLSAEGGARRLRPTEQLTGLLRQFAAGFTDPRDPDLLEHTVQELVAPRVAALAWGSEDLNDHDDLRRHPRLATLLGQLDPTGQTRPRRRERGQTLAAKSTLHRRELTPAGSDEDSRSQKITCPTRVGGQWLVTLLLPAPRPPPERLVWDRDATEDPSHGPQLGRFFHGSSPTSGSRPLPLFGGDHRLGARRPPWESDASAGAWKPRKRIGAPIHADRGFCRQAIRRWCEDHQGDDVLGRAKNPRLVAALADELPQATPDSDRPQQAGRVFQDLRSQTRESGSRQRRVVAPAEPLDQGANPRFGVPTLWEERRPARPWSAEDSCGRGERENRIPEQPLPLVADRPSAAPRRAHPIRLFFSSMAEVVREAWRRRGRAGTERAEAPGQTLRSKLLKIGAWVRVTVRQVGVKLSRSSP